MPGPDSEDFYRFRLRLHCLSIHKSLSGLQLGGKYPPDRELQEMERKNGGKVHVTRRGAEKSLAASSGATCDFLLSGFTDERKAELCKMITALGGRYHKSYSSRCTHVISSKPMRSEKYLCAVAAGKWILKPDFITLSAGRGRWEVERGYEWSEGDLEAQKGGVPPGLLIAPRKWRERVCRTGQGAFSGWRVLIHVKNFQKRCDVYRRVLQSGGAHYVPLTLPIKDPAALAKQLTHVFVDKVNEKDIECLEVRGIPCLLPEFIAEHLFEAQPSMEAYKVSQCDSTPTQTRNRTTLVVSSVPEKTAPSNGRPHVDSSRVSGGRGPLQPQTSAGRDTDTVTPALTSVSGRGQSEQQGQGSSSSSADCSCGQTQGCGVKRKLHFTPALLRESLQILKKRKLSSQHTPLVPYTMTLPRPKKTFQCASECISRPFHANMCNMAEAVLEESEWLEALSCIAASVSTQFYPPPHIMHKMMLQVLQSPNLQVCRSAIHILKQVLCLHSPASHVTLRLFYLECMAPPRPMGGPTFYNAHWQFLESVIRRALDGRQVIEEAAEHQDEHAVKVAMEMAEMLLHFLVALMEEDYMMAHWRKEESGSQRLYTAGPAHCILAKVLWPSSLQQASKKVPVNGRQLMICFVDAVMMAAKCDDWVAVTTLISTLILIAAELSSTLGEEGSPRNPDVGCNEARREFCEQLASIAKKGGILSTRGSQELFLSLLKPSWLCQGVSECFLINYNDALLGEDRLFWVSQPLSLKKIVSYYFYLVPPRATAVKTEAEPKSSPLKTINNQQQPGKQVPIKPSGKNLNVNRRNARGETPLHQACIKGDVSRVKELLTSPYIDVNAQDYAGWTSLHEACLHGNVQCVEELLNFLPGRQPASTPICEKLTLDLLKVPPCGTTALHDAVLNHHLEIVRLLVTAGGITLLPAKNQEGKTALDLAATDVMKNALKGLRPGEVSPSEKENRNKPAPHTVGSPLGSPESRPTQPPLAHYQQLLGISLPPGYAPSGGGAPTAAAPSGGSGYLTQEALEGFVVTLAALLQSYVRSHDLHRVKAETDLIKAQRKMVSRLQLNGVQTSVSEDTPFVSVVGAPTLCRATLPPTPAHQDPVHTDTGPSMDRLHEDMEVFVELSRHAEGLKEHLRILGPTTTDTIGGPSKVTVVTRVTRTMRLISHLTAVMS